MTLIERLRTDAEEIRKDIYPRWKNPDEIMDEAASALEKRDAEIEILKAEVDLYRSACDRRDSVFTAQRKVLEQALEAMQRVLYKDGGEPAFFAVRAAITAIQELK